MNETRGGPGWPGGFGGGPPHAGHPGPWGFGGPPWMRHWGGGPRGPRGRPRPRRGDVRLAILTLLAEEPMHGYQIITELGARSGGIWRPSPGSIYPTLQQLQDEGLVSVDEQDGRRTFSLTETGRAEAQNASTGRRAPWDQMTDDDHDGAARLRERAGQVMAAVMQVAVAGTDEHIDRAEQLLTQTRRGLYRLLAEDETEEDETGEKT
jgi:DNA-binding PadR family transcriptional regulator